MRIIFILSWVIFITGVIFQFFHMPGTAIFLLTGGLLFLIHSSMFCQNNFTKQTALCFLYITVSLISIYIVGRLHFWAWSKIVHFLVYIFFILTIIFSLVIRNRPKFPQLFLLCYFSFIVWFSFVPSYKLYYAIRLNTLLNSESRNFDYRSWDKYSWFLNIRNKNKEALEANRMAAMAVNTSIETKGDTKAKDYLKLIEQHKFQLEHKQWVEYP